MRLLVISVLAVFAVLSSAAPRPSTHAVHEKREASPKQWMKGDRLWSEALLPVRVGLKQRNIENGYDYLLEV
jgi:tripeptidyl-peptidase-1